MNILIKKAKVIDSTSSYNGKTVDILIERGEITEIKSSIKPEKAVKMIEGNQLMVSLGWIDMQTVFSEPGYEYREDLESGLNTSAAGGFTHVCVMSDTNPPLYNKAQIDYLINKSQAHLVDILPIGTISHRQEGKDLSEMYDMQQAGAVAFSDYKQPIKDAGLVLRALQYSKNIQSFIITHCDDKSISHDGQVHEGVVSTRLGLKGIPALAEEIMVQRNLSIVDYTDGKLHFPTISTRGSVELIKKAKANGLQVTCGVAAYNLLLDESSLEGFDTNYKTNPPLRSKEHVEYLRKAVINGTIDVIVSDHAPQDIESKDVEFDLANFGIINAQTAFSVALSAIGKSNIETIINGLTLNPRKILNLPTSSIKEGSKACLTLFTLEEKTVLTPKTNLSKSTNSPFFNKKLEGKVIGVINNNQAYINS